MPFGLCNATATFQRLMPQSLTIVTKKYGNLVMCYVDDVVVATPTLKGPHGATGRSICIHEKGMTEFKPSKSGILKDSIKYLGRMEDKHGIRPNQMP